MSEVVVDGPHLKHPLTRNDIEYLKYSRKLNDINMYIRRLNITQGPLIKKQKELEEKLCEIKSKQGQ